RLPRSSRGAGRCVYRSGRILIPPRADASSVAHLVPDPQNQAFFDSADLVDLHGIDDRRVGGRVIGGRGLAELTLLVGLRPIKRSPTAARFFACGGPGRVL